MKSSLGWCGILLALGCAPRSEAPPVPAPVIPAAPAASAPVTPTAPAASPSPAPSAGPCLPGELHSHPFSGEPVAPHVELAGIEVRVGASDCTLRVLGKDGKVRSKKRCNAGDDAGQLELVIRAVCDAGGDMYWLDGKPTEGAPVRMKVGRYVKHDEAADVDSICAPFSALKNPRTGRAIDGPGLDDAQRGRIRAEILEETMTSPKWRLWLRDLGRTLEKDQSGPLLDELRKAAAHQGLSACDAEWLKPR